MFLFQHDYKLTVYVYDDKGYHEIPVESGVTDFRPALTSDQCDLSKGEYCIDQKLLAILVG